MFGNDSKSAIFTQVSPFLTSAKPMTKEGGVVELYGTMGTGISALVLIDGAVCNVTEVKTDHVFCIIGPTRVGLLPLIVTVDGYNYTSNSLAFFADTAKYCESTTPPCNGHGKCDSQGQCLCDEKWAGDLCELKIGGYPGGGVDNGISTLITDQNITFGFSMTSIQEMQLGEVIREIPVGTWKLESNSKENGINKTVFALTMLDVVNVETIIEMSELARTVEFAGLVNNLAPNSMKITVNITGWPYLSELNSLRVIFTSSLVSFPPECTASPSTQVNTDNYQSVKFLKIIKQGVAFYGRFQDRSLSDGRPTYTSNSIVKQDQVDQEIQIGVSLPKCNECIIDPDLSLLITDEGVQSCHPTHSNLTLILAVTFGVIGAVIIVLVVGYIVKKKYYISFQDKSLKMSRRT
eukprot:gene12226-14316_t